MRRNDMVIFGSLAAAVIAAWTQPGCATNQAAAPASPPARTAPPPTVPPLTTPAALPGQKQNGAAKLNKPRTMARTLRYMDQLNLTQEQQDKIKSIQQNSLKQARAIRDDQALSMEERRTRLKDLRVNSDAQIKLTLTPDQQKKLADAILTETAQRQAAQRLNQYSALNLTEPQKAKLTAVFVEEARQRTALQLDDRAVGPDRAARMQQIRDSSESQVKQILTSSQWQKWQDAIAGDAADRQLVAMLRQYALLKLSPDQTTRLKALFTDAAKQLQLVQNDKALTPRDRAQKSEQIQESMDAQVQQILTPEQKQKLEQRKNSSR